METVVLDAISNANLAKELVLIRLVKDGVISEETANKYIENWQIVVFKPNLFKRWMNKFRKDADNDSYILKYLKFED